MKAILPLLAITLIFLLLRFLGLVGWGRILRWLEARPGGPDPLWQQVQAVADRQAKRFRMPCPEILVVPEFSANLLIFRTLPGGLRLVLTEGLVRALSARELEAALALGLAHGRRRGLWLFSTVAMVLFPLAQLLQAYPLVLQFVWAPCLALSRSGARQARRTFRADQEAAKQAEPLVVAAALQKMSVVGRKIPLKQWNFALDPLFLLSPLVLESAPLWLFVSQPSVEKRRESLLHSAGMAAFLPPVGAARNEHEGAGASAH